MHVINWAKQLTIWGESQLSTHHTGISVAPEIITDSTPSTTDAHFNPSISVTTSSRQTNVIVFTDGCKQMIGSTAMRKDNQVCIGLM